MTPASTNRGDMINVLHVDDEPELVDLAATYLEREDDRIKVHTATTVEDGLKIINDYKIDCIVSDHDMPDKNGIEFLKLIREQYSNLPFILYTGKGSEEVASNAISVGVSDYLQKGTGAEQYTILANRIINLVRQRRAEADLETRIQQQEIVTTLGQDALAGADLDQLFDTAVEAIAETLNNEYAEVLEYRPESEELLLQSGVGWPDGLIGQATVSDGKDSPAGYTLQSEASVIVEHLPTEDRFRSPPLFVDHDIQSGISVIIGDPDDSWGVLGTHTTKRKSFTNDDVMFVQNVANILATAIKRTIRERELSRNKRAMDEAPIGVTISDPAQEDNPIIYANQSFQDVAGYSEDEILGRNCRFLQGEDTDPEPIAAMREAIDAEERMTTELRNYRKDGTVFWNQVSIAPVRDDEGSVINYVGFQRDITEDRKRKEVRERQRETLIELATDEAVAAGNFKTALRRITETSADVLEVPRVNVWLIDDDSEDTLTCVNHYEQTVEEHREGMELSVNEYPAYFEALESHQTIASNNAREDPRTAELTDDYLMRHDISALLDATIRSEGEVIGMICHETVGQEREWTDDEIEFASDIADIVHRALRNQERKEREQQLSEITSRLEALFDNSPDMINVLDSEGALLDVNRRFCQELEYGEDEVLGRQIWEIDKLVDKKDVTTLLADFELDERRKFEGRYERCDGSTFPVEVHLLRLDLDGKDRFLAISRDITERKEHERELQKEHDRFRAVFEEAFDAMVLADEAGKYIEVNQRATELFDLSKEELLGRSIEEFAPEDFDFETAWHDFQASDNERGIFRIVQPDGTERIVEYAATSNVTPGQHLSVLRDVTEREQRRRELEETHEQIEFALNATDSVIWGINLDTLESIEYGPVEEVFGQGLDGIDDFLENIVHPEDREEVEHILESIQEGETVEYDVEFRTMPEEGNIRWIASTGYVQEATDQSPPRLIGLATDVTDQIQRERELQHQNDRLEQFAGIVSHDLRNPLNVAESWLELAQVESDNSDLDKIAQAHNRMRLLIDDLLALAHDGGSESTSLELIDLIERCWQTVNTKNATLVIDTDQTIHANESRVRQLFENLIRNAVEHGGHDVTVTIGELDTGFYIEDDGSGIPEEDCEEIFNAGYSTISDGTGLGLSIVKQVADEHAWNIRVTDGNDGGARFEIQTV